MSDIVCKMCKKRFYPRQVNDQEICFKCTPKINKEIEMGAMRITQAMDKAFSIEAVGHKLKIYDKIISIADKLGKYEKIGLEVMKPPPSYISNYYLKLKRSLIESRMEKDIVEIMHRLNGWDTERKKLGDLSRLRLKVMKYRDAAKYHNISFRKHLDNVIDKIQAQELCYQGAKHRHNGQIAFALSNYRRVLKQLLTDDIDDSLQAKDIRFLQTRIALMKKKAKRKAIRKTKSKAKQAS